MSRIEELIALGRIDEAAEEIKSRIETPKFHVYPYKGGYVNDVNAFFKYKGRYHLFYQYSSSVEDAPPKVWHHSSGTDLVHWEYHGEALGADMPYDREGAWSGNVFFDENGLPVIAYYAFGAGVCLARPKDPDDEYLIEWVKDGKNPIIPADEEGRECRVYDVSNIWRDGDRYCLITGNKSPATGRPTSYLFTAEDLYDWRLEGEFISPDCLEDKDDMACPNVMQFGNGIYLYTFSSHYSGVQYFTGRIEGGKFKTLKSGRFNYYGGNEMGQSCFSEDGKIIYMSWLVDMRPTEQRHDSGWCGMLTLPKVLTCDGEGNVCIAMLDGVRSIFEDKGHLFKKTVVGEELLPASGAELLIEGEIDLSACRRAGFDLRVGKDHATRIYYDTEEKRLCIDYSRSYEKEFKRNKHLFWFRDYEPMSVQKSDVLPLLGNVLKLSVVLDRSALEVYANGISMSRVIFPPESAVGAAAFADGSADFNVTVKRLK